MDGGLVISHPFFHSQRFGAFRFQPPGKHDMGPTFPAGFFGAEITGVAIGVNGNYLLPQTTQDVLVVLEIAGSHNPAA